MLSEKISNVQHAPEDAIFGVKKKFMESPLKEKYLLSVGVYRTDDALPYTFEAVKQAEDRILHKYSKDYLPMTGYAPFVEHARELLFTKPILEKYGDRIGSLQSCAGTGALYLTSRFVKEFLNINKIFLSDPTWPNYRKIFGSLEHSLLFYPYIDPKTNTLDINGMVDAISKGPECCLVVLQVCAHNPTGVDPNMEQWDRIFKVCKEKQDLICFDFAYMGFASGDMDVDAQPVRRYIEWGLPFFCCFSFSKCMGLYGERVGCLHAFCQTKEEAENIKSQLAVIVRETWSVCPQNGSYIAAEVLNDENLTKDWAKEVTNCGQRMITIRNKFCDLLEEKTKKSWDFIRQQKGMFAHTGFDIKQVGLLAEEGVFLPNNGLVSIPALNTANVEFVAQAFANVLKKSA